MKQISNSEARELLLHSLGLSSATSNQSPLEAIRHLGLVQLDPIQVLARAHHHIIWSRCSHYQKSDFDKLLEHTRSVFEHFTHDASILPVEIYPYWRRQFTLIAKRFQRDAWSNEMPPQAEQQEILQRITDEGPLCSRDFQGKANKTLHAWMRKPYKLALDYLWYRGILSVSHRRNFIKYYDLTERVIPSTLLNEQRSDDEQIDYLCREALKRLVFATPKEIQLFWEAMSVAEVKNWISKHQADLTTVEVETADKKTYTAYAFTDIDQLIQSCPTPTSRLRIMSPFDPLIRDRQRLKRLFDFDYRIEIYTPASKRQYGYYVYPILEGSRIIGRIEVKADRKTKQLRVENLWLEKRLTLSRQRKQKLNTELKRLARFTNTDEIIWTNPPL